MKHLIHLNENFFTDILYQLTEMLANIANI